MLQGPLSGVLLPLPLVWALGCAAPEPAPVAPDPVWVAGCAEWVDGVCLVDGATTLRVWHHGDADVAWRLVAATEAPLEARVDRQAALGALEVSPGDEVRLEGDGHPVWTLRVGDAAEVEALAEARALYERARVPGEADVLELLERSTARYGALGAVIGPARNHTLAAWHRAEQGRELAAARAALEGLAAAPPVAEVHMWRAWALGILETRVGRFGAAVRAFEEQARLAELLGEPARARAARGEIAHLLQLSGQHRRALQVHAELVDAAEEGDPFCARARALNNQGWASLVAVQRGVEDVPDPEPILEGARRALRDDCRGVAGLRANVLLNLALAAERRGPDAARAALDAARPALVEPTVEQRLAEGSLRARLARDEGRLDEALEGFRAVERLAGETDRVHLVWGALSDQAGVLASLGRVDEALSRFEQADRLAAEHAAFVPITLGRDAFLAERDRAARDHVALLLALDRPAEALAVVRRLRRSFVASLRQAERLDGLDPEARARWDEAVGAYRRLREEREQLARDAWQVDDAGRAAFEARVARLRERTVRLLDDALPAGVEAGPLRAPEPGERLLVWFEDRDGLVVFAADAAGTRAVRVAGPTALPEALRAGSGLTRLTLLPYGPVRGLDLHTALASGGDVVPDVPLAWSLDLGARAGAPSAAVVGVVSDPRGDLPWARREGDEVRAALAPGRAVRTLDRDEATHAALRDLIPEVDLLHFAGHGSFGEQPWEAELLTAHDGRFSVADVLALPRVPARVVLSGCETARTRDVAVENLGIAQAFVAAGASSAVAAAREVDDALARAFSAALYRHGYADGDPAVAFRAATLEVAAAMPGADVGAFRLLVP